MAGFSNYAENAILNSLFGKSSDLGALDQQPTIYVALCTESPTDTSTGSTIEEADYGTYTRVLTSASSWSIASGGSISNATAILFPESTGGSNTITHFVLVDSASGGNILCFGALDEPKTIIANDAPAFQIGSIIVNLD